MVAEPESSDNPGTELEMMQPTGQVHLRWTMVEESGDESLDTRFLAILSAEERARYQRFRFDRDRRLYLAAHTLLRFTLSEFGDQPPEDWAFGANEHGKPFLDPGFGDPPLHFNLTHAAGLAACVVARGVEVGVDAESIHRKTEPGLSGRFFAPKEQAQLEGLAGEPRQRTFFDIWTLKESYIKGRGIGMALPRRSVAFALPTDDRDTIGFTPPPGDPSGDWRFFRFRPDPHHTLAVAVNQPPDTEPRVGSSSAVTLADLI
jgi:4'-phosphopantetheinyl transferase